MITAANVIRLSEDWVMTISEQGRHIDIFVNPSKAELIELYNLDQEHKVRFIADNKTKKFYVWTVFGVIHRDVADKLGLSNRLVKRYPEDILSGVAEVSGGKCIFTNSDSIYSIQWSLSRYRIDRQYPEMGMDAINNKIDRGYLSKVLETDWSWLRPYLDYSDFFNKIKKTLDTPVQYR